MNPKDIQGVRYGEKGMTGSHHAARIRLFRRPCRGLLTGYALKPSARWGHEEAPADRCSPPEHADPHLGLR